MVILNTGIQNLDGKIKMLLKYISDHSVMPSKRLFGFNGINGGLILIFGQSGSGKTALLRKWAECQSYFYLTFGSLISEWTIGSSRSEWTDAVQREFQTLVESAEGDTVLCDNLELLFASDLSLDPLRLLKQASRRKAVVAAWNGSYDGSTLSYAAPGHDEYRAYSPAELADVTLLSVNEANAL